MVELTIGSLLPILMLLYLVPWSDFNGRKLLITISLSGKALEMLVYMIVSSIPKCPAYFLIIGQFLKCLGGDYVLFSNAVYSYMYDITTLENRIHRMTIMASVWFLGQPVGLLLGTSLAKLGGYTTVFAISFLLHFLSVLYSVFILSNSIEMDSIDQNCPPKLGLFSRKNVKHLFQVIKESGHSRSELALLVTLYTTVFSGKPHLIYFWVRLMQGWSMQQFTSTMAAYLFICNCSVLLISIFVRRRKLITDAVVGAIVMSLDIIALIILANITGTNNEYLIYIGFIIGMNHKLARITIRARIIKLARPEEVGRMLFLASIVELCWPLVNTVQFTILYNMTLSYNPSAIHLLSLVYAVLGVVLSIVLIYRERYKERNNSENLYFQELWSSPTL